jgi:hypothetical protein
MLNKAVRVNTSRDLVGRFLGQGHDWTLVKETGMILVYLLRAYTVCISCAPAHECSREFLGWETNLQDYCSSLAEGMY